MAIYRLLENSAFDPERISVMVAAYERACRELDLICSKTDSVTELVAKKIIEIAHTETDLDAQGICDRSLHALGITKH